MGVLDELNEKIEELCAIAERERERILDQMWDMRTLPSEVAALALDYAQWTHTLEGYRSLLRGGDNPLRRVQ